MQCMHKGYEEETMDFKQIQTVIKDFEKSSITSLDIELEGIKIKLRKGNHMIEEEKHVISQVIFDEKQGQSGVAQAVLEKGLPTKIAGFEVKAPLVGTFYAAAGPEAPLFATVGKKVKKGDTLCIIEAMKIMNEIASPMDGTIKEILVKDGEAIGFDQLLMTIE